VAAEDLSRARRLARAHAHPGLHLRRRLRRPAVPGKSLFLDMAARRQLLARGLAFEPDVVIANGDHIYHDIESALVRPSRRYFEEQVWPKFGGALDTSVPMLHPRNAAIFTKICDYQIAGLYGTSLRSTRPSS
jgi:hypothetical protein